MQVSWQCFPSSLEASLIYIPKCNLETKVQGATGIQIIDISIPKQPFSHWSTTTSHVQCNQKCSDTMRDYDQIAGIGKVTTSNLNMAQPKVARSSPLSNTPTGSNVDRSSTRKISREKHSRKQNNYKLYRNGDRKATV